MLAVVVLGVIVTVVGLKFSHVLPRAEAATEDNRLLLKNNLFTSTSENPKWPGQPVPSAPAEAKIRTALDFSDESLGAERRFAAENAAYGFDVSCDSNGITIRSTSQQNSKESNWTFSIINPDPSRSPFLSAASTVSYERGSGHAEWYINSGSGIEHGMNLAIAPSSTEKPLKFYFKVSSDLHYGGGSENNLIFKDRHGVPALRYEKLIAFDAKGRIIPTALTWDDANSSIAWQVDHQGFEYPIVIDPIIATFAQTLTPPSTIVGSFGDAIAVVGDFMAVGTPSSNRVYLYEKTGGTWSLFSRKNFLVSPATNDGAFGAQVEMPDKDTIIVSDPSFDAPTQTGGTNANQGALFIFGRNVGGDNNWGVIKQFTVTEPQLIEGRLADRLGTVISFSENRIAAVAIRDGDSFDTATKFFYIFEKDRGGINNWGQIPNVKIESLNFASGFNFGKNCDLAGDFLVVGSPAENFRETPGSPTVQFQGAVYIYGRNQGGINQWGLLPNGRIYAPDGMFGDFFGWSVSISGDLIAVGATSRDLSPSLGGAGVVYLLSRNQGGTDAWGVLPIRITAADAAAGDSFGSVVQLDGDLLAVHASGDDVAGQNNVGSVYLFEKNKGGDNNWGAVVGGKFSIDNVSDIVKVKSTVYLAQSHLAFATSPSVGNSSLSIVNLSGRISWDQGIGQLTLSRDGVVTFVPREAGAFQLRTSINLTTWADEGAVRPGNANTAITFNVQMPAAGQSRFFRIERK